MYLFLSIFNGKACKVYEDKERQTLSLQCVLEIILFMQNEPISSIHEHVDTFHFSLPSASIPYAPLSSFFLLFRFTSF